MGKCIFCSKNAGLLRNAHGTCRQKYVEGWTGMIADVRMAITGEADCGALLERLVDRASNSYIGSNKVKDALIEGWGHAVDQFLDDHNLDAAKEKKLTDFASLFGLTDSELNRTGAWTKVVKGAVIRDLLNGIAPRRIKLEGELPFNLQKDEEPVWLFNGVKYYEDRTRRRYEGGYSGVSVRIARGLYYRTGGFRGNPVETTERTWLQSGVMLITTKHIYFTGPVESFRIPHAKIVAFTPYSDGVGVQRDAPAAKPQTFVTGDGWFTYNLLANIGHVGT